MHRLTQPNSWTCLPTSLAMIAEEKLETILDIIGHDGSVVEWPDLPEPYSRRGFCINEIIYAALECGIALVETNQTCMFHPQGIEEAAKPYTIMHTGWEEQLLESYEAILLGEGHSGESHAVAWNPGKRLIYDPNGSRYNLEFFRRELVYVAFRVGSKDWRAVRKEKLQRRGSVPSGSVVCPDSNLQNTDGTVLAD
jgi:hypothetical protein